MLADDGVYISQGRAVNLTRQTKWSIRWPCYDIPSTLILILSFGTLEIALFLDNLTKTENMIKFKVLHGIIMRSWNNVNFSGNIPPKMYDDTTQSCHSNVKKTQGQKCNINSSDSRPDKTGLNIIKFYW